MYLALVPLTTRPGAVRLNHFATLPGGFPLLRPLDEVRPPLPRPDRPDRPSKSKRPNPDPLSFNLSSLLSNLLSNLSSPVVSLTSCFLDCAIKVVGLVSILFFKLKS